MPDGQLISAFYTEDTGLRPGSGYSPPLALLLQGLDVTELELNRRRVSVSASFLKFLIGELARTMRFDSEFYAAAYPDVEAARLAGEVPTLQEHFVTQGYFERRQPREMPFDPAYYGTRYDDLAQVFGPNDYGSLRAHFLNHGWQEGRAAVPWQSEEAERWVVAARAGAQDALEVPPI